MKKKRKKEKNILEEYNRLKDTLKFKEDEFKILRKPHEQHDKKKEIEAVKQESMSMIKQTLKDLLHDKHINKTTNDHKIFLYINDLKNAYTLHQIKDIETNFNEYCSVIEKIYEENIPYRDNIYKKIYNGILTLINQQKIPMEESDNIRKSFEIKVYNATTHEELKAALTDFNNYYNNKMELPEQEEEHSFLSNKNNKYMIFVKVIL